MVQLFLLVILGWPATRFERPVLLAGIYGVIIWMLAIIAGATLSAAVIMAGISLAIALAYYLLLARFSDSLGIWLAILIGVPFLIVIANFAFRVNA